MVWKGEDPTSAFTEKFWVQRVPTMLHLVSYDVEFHGFLTPSLLAGLEFRDLLLEVCDLTLLAVQLRLITALLVLQHLVVAGIMHHPEATEGHPEATKGHPEASEAPSVAVHGRGDADVDVGPRRHPGARIASRHCLTWRRRSGPEGGTAHAPAAAAHAPAGACRLGTLQRHQGNHQRRADRRQDAKRAAQGIYLLHMCGLGDLLGGTRWWKCCGARGKEPVVPRSTGRWCWRDEGKAPRQADADQASHEKHWP
mmetsp:Transcript_25917/g.41498  ORF Transcript_25917/g.41498 Transcript_25917/m.41498 type:complete len:254 (-) Transcript_25917:105-866(-)